MTGSVSEMTLALGDHVRLKTLDANHYQSLTESDLQILHAREAVDGVVFSIRNLRTGALVASTSGSLDEFMIELVIDDTFSPKVASQRNAPKGTERAVSTPGWRKLRAALRAATREGTLVSTNMPGVENSPVIGLLDGYKVLKVWSSALESLEALEAVV